MLLGVRMNTKKLLKAISVCLIFYSSNAAAEINWKVFSSRTNIKFKVKHFVLMEVEGQFKNPQGMVNTASENDFTNAHVEARIPVNTVTTGNVDRDTHLKKEVFFYADKFPEMVFKSKKVVKKSNGEYSMLGDLSIRGVTLPIIFNVVNSGSKQSSDGKLRSKFVAKGSVNRYDYGLKWNEVTEAGGMVVGDKVDIEMDVTLEKAGTVVASSFATN